MGVLSFGEKTEGNGNHNWQKKNWNVFNLVCYTGKTRPKKGNCNTNTLSKCDKTNRKNLTTCHKVTHLYGMKNFM